MKVRLSLPSVVLFAASLAISAPAGASLVATSTVNATQLSPTTYDYTLTLNNTGTTTIGTFWFSWIPGAGFLSAAPANVSSPAGWTSTTTNSGAAIRWTTTTNLLAAGSSLTGFEFNSTETPTQLASSFTTASGVTEPAAVFFVYQTAVPPLTAADPGYQAVANVVTPEPPSLLLALTGVAAAGLLFWRRDASATL